MDHPDPDEIEITLFGPGFGECVVVHLGHGRWLIVDSCYGAWCRSDPAPVWYLKQLNVDLESQISMILTSHWHDDHVGGLAKVVRQASKAPVYISQALMNLDFLALVELYGKSPIDEPGISEISSVFRQCRGGRLRFAVQDKVVLTAPLCQITSLSPSDQSVQNALAAFAKQSGLIQPGDSPLRIPTLKPNHTSVALWISNKFFGALLGADLEVTPSPLTGWHAILNSSTTFSGRASYFKIPHHGSENGHHRELWKDRLERDVTAALTPFKNGGVELPLARDIQRIQSLTPNAYATGKPKIKKATLPAPVEKTIREMGKVVVEHPIARGFVRARRKVSPDSAWRVQCFYEADTLEKVFA